MNRDERRVRAAALPPAIVDLDEGRAIFPREPNGGTWISANDAGVCIALINWHYIEREPAGEIVSRGEITRALVGKSSTREIANALAALPLRKLRPFRVIAIVPSQKAVTEWRWNLERLSARKHPWRLQHWFSSGLDEQRAELERRQICNIAKKRSSVTTLSWLRRLHRSHAPKRGPFSICMHRPDAATVSYTEVAISDRRVIMRYKPGSSCSGKSTIAKSLPFAR